MRCVWSPYLLQHIKRVESVQKRFTKRLPISHLGYIKRLKAIGLESLELRRLHCDLLCTYKVLFGKLELDYTNMFVIRSQSATRAEATRGNCSQDTVVQLLVNISSVSVS